MPPALPKPVRYQRHITQEQTSWTILKFGELRSLSGVRRAFRLKLFPENERNVPGRKVFHRLIERFETVGAVLLLTTPGQAPTPDVDVSRGKTFSEDNPDSHVRGAAERLGLSFGKVWTILRKKLNWKPYRPHLATALSPGNMEPRLAACTFWLQREEDWFEGVV